MSPFCGATDIPVLDFWWRLLWVSKPEWVLLYSSLAEVYVLCYTFPESHLWCNTCQPLGSQHGSWAVSTYLRGIGRTRNRELSCCRSQCEIRQTLYRLSYPGSASLIKLQFFGWTCRFFGWICSSFEWICSFFYSRYVTFCGGYGPFTGKCVPYDKKLHICHNNLHIC